MRHLILAAALLVASPALAQDHRAHGGAAAAAKASDAAADARVKPDARAASREITAINARMHAGMSVAPTGDIDLDFVRNMIPHHQGAIQMAELTLRHSTDPTIRTLARNIAGAQRREITAMRAWLRTKGKTER